MTPDQITQLRQFIKNWQAEAGKYTTKTKFEAVLVDVINTKCDSLLTLLPCSTCEEAHTTSCPDCQPKPCKTCWGTKKKRLPGSYMGGSVYEVCPDCQEPIKKPSTSEFTKSKRDWIKMNSFLMDYREVVVELAQGILDACDIIDEKKCPDCK